MNEELDITVLTYSFLGEFIHPDGAKNMTFLIESWKGDPKPLEAERLAWITNGHELTNELDREMLKSAQLRVRNKE